MVFFNWVCKLPTILQHGYDVSKVMSASWCQIFHKSNSLFVQKVQFAKSLPHTIQQTPGRLLYYFNSVASILSHCHILIYGVLQGWLSIQQFLPSLHSFSNFSYLPNQSPSWPDIQLNEHLTLWRLCQASFIEKNIITTVALETLRALIIVLYLCSDLCLATICLRRSTNSVRLHGLVFVLAMLCKLWAIIDPDVCQCKLF